MNVKRLQYLAGLLKEGFEFNPAEERSLFLTYPELLEFIVGDYIEMQEEEQEATFGMGISEYWYDYLETLSYFPEDMDDMLDRFSDDEITDALLLKLNELRPDWEEYQASVSFDDDDLDEEKEFNPAEEDPFDDETESGKANREQVKAAIEAVANKRAVQNEEGMNGLFKDIFDDEDEEGKEIGLYNALFHIGQELRHGDPDLDEWIEDLKTYYKENNLDSSILDKLEQKDFSGNLCHEVGMKLTWMKQRKLRKQRKDDEAFDDFFKNI